MSQHVAVGFSLNQQWLISQSILPVFVCAIHVAETAARSANEEKYFLLSGICAIPDKFSQNFSRELVSVSRAVCRTACTTIFDNDCSGFLYRRRTQSCTLTPYTGDWLVPSAAECDPRNGLEFYRRIRLSGK